MKKVLTLSEAKQLSEAKKVSSRFSRVVVCTALFAIAALFAYGVYGIVVDVLIPMKG